MKAKPSIDAFLSGGAAAAVENSEQAGDPVPSAPEQRRTKSIRITATLDMLLKEEAFKRTMAAGRRINESDLIEEALRGYFKLPGK